MSPDASEVGQPEITERLADDIEERVVEEIILRQTLIGAAYPFELRTVDDGRLSHLRIRPSWNDLTNGELFYVFCLLDSGIRDGLISFPRAQRNLVQKIGNIFQICA